MFKKVIITILIMALCGVAGVYIAGGSIENLLPAKVADALSPKADDPTATDSAIDVAQNFPDRISPEVAAGLEAPEGAEETLTKPIEETDDDDDDEVITVEPAETSKKEENTTQAAVETPTTKPAVDTPVSTGTSVKPSTTSAAVTTQSTNSAVTTQSSVKQETKPTLSDTKPAVSTVATKPSIAENQTVTGAAATNTVTTEPAIEIPPIVEPVQEPEKTPAQEPQQTPAQEQSQQQTQVQEPEKTPSQDPKPQETAQEQQPSQESSKTPTEQQPAEKPQEAQQTTTESEKTPAEEPQQTPAEQQVPTQDPQQPAKEQQVPTQDPQQPAQEQQTPAQEPEQTLPPAEQTTENTDPQPSETTAVEVPTVTLSNPDDPKTQARIKYITTKNKTMSKEDAAYLVALFEHFTENRDYLDTEILMGIARIESGFNPALTGKYMGMMQVSLYYGQTAGYTEAQLATAYYNLEYACSILDDLNRRFSGDIKYIVLGYNQGYYGLKAKIDNGAEINYYFYNKCETYANQIKALYPAE